jgi:Bacterial Ig-like domain (group 2)
MLMRTIGDTATPSHRSLLRLAGSFALFGYLVACGGKDAPAPVCAVTAVNVAPATGSVAVGESLNLSAAVVQTNCTGLTTTWTSSNPAVATVSSTGTVTGVTAGGPVLITAQAGGGSGSAAIVVTPAAIASISLTAPSAATTCRGGHSPGRRRTRPLRRRTGPDASRE